MAIQIRIHTSVEVVQDNTEDVQGITYTQKSLDGNADSRSWGGSYNIATAYTDADVCYWKGVVVSATSADALADNSWTEASAVSDGTIPDNIYCVAVEYASQSIGAASEVTLTVSGEIFAVLTPGEAVVIPISSNNANSAVLIHDANYGNGTREALVNVMIAGT